MWHIYSHYSADIVHGVGHLEGIVALRRTDEVAPLVAHVAHDAVPGVHQLLRAARRTCREPPTSPGTTACKARTNTGDTGPSVFFAGHVISALKVHGPSGSTAYGPLGPTRRESMGQVDVVGNKKKT